MSNPNRKRFLIFPTLLFTLLSCTNPSPAKEATTAAPVVEPKIESVALSDTILRLEFESMVRSILEDSKGNFWFGSDREGVARYDGESFTYFTMADGMSHNQIRTIQEDQDGNIWFATGNGVCKYDGEKMATQKTLQGLTAGILPEEEWKKEANDLWFNGEVEGGIYRYDGQQLSVLPFPVLPDDHESFSISGTVTGISYGQDNRLWVANYGGVIGFDGTSFKYINEKGTKYHVRSILEDSKGNLWIGNNGIGVLRYTRDTTINFTKKMRVWDVTSVGGGATSPQATLNHVFAIAEDAQGNIWFGDRDTGAWRYDGKQLKNYTIKDGLKSLFIRVIYKDNSGGLWFGTEGGGVCKFNGIWFEQVF